jgi:hypothetical protein
VAKTGPSYVAIPRKWVMAWITVNIVLFVGILGAYQYTFYIAQQTCGVIKITTETYQETPSTTATGKILATEFKRLARKYHCN